MRSTVSRGRWFTRLTRDPEVVHRDRWWILAVLNLSLVIIVAGNSSLNVALPTFVRDLHATNSQLEWLVDLYSLMFAGLVLPMGALGDRFGRKGLLQTGLLIFAIAALGGTFATEPWHLIFARAVMGIGAAMIMPATLSILTNVFPPEERARAIGIWAGFAGAGVTIGPLASGFLLDRFWYGSVFFINVPTIAVALLAGAFLLPTSSDPRHRALDLVGSVLSILGLTSLLFAIIQAPTRGWADPVILSAFVVAAVVLTGFVLWERHSDHPMLPIEQFEDARFSAGAGAISLTFFAMFGLFFISTQYLQFVLGYSPLRAGAALLPMAILMLVAAPRSAMLAERFGRNRVIASGLFLIAIGMLVMSTLTPVSPYLRVAIALCAFGAGLGFATAPATGAIMESMPLAKAGVGSAVNDTTREVGGSLGVAVFGSLLATSYHHHLSQHVHLAPALAASARSSIGAALAVSQQLPAPASHSVALAARYAFTDAMKVVFIVCAIFAIVAGVLQFVVMPGRVGRPVEPALAEEARV